MQSETGFCLPEHQVIPAKFVEAWLAQAEMLATARQHLARTQEEIEELEQNAYEKGYLAGAQVGNKNAIEFIRKAAITYESARNMLWEESVEIVEQCVRKIIGDIEIQERVARMIERTLDEKKDIDAAVLKVSPTLAAELGETLEYRHAQKQHVLHVQPDPNLEGERCIVMCPRHIVECSIETQIQSIKQTLLAFPPEFEENTYALEDEDSPEIVIPPRRSVFEDDTPIGISE